MSVDANLYYATRTVLQTEGGYISPGSFHGCRVATIHNHQRETNNVSFVATANEIYRINVSALPPDAKPEELTPSLVPPPISVSSTQEKVPCKAQLKSEIQSICWSPGDNDTDGSLLSIDSLGIAVIHKFTARGCEKIGELQLKPSHPARELGWCGIACTPAQDTIMTCRKSDKEITVYDAQGNCTRTLKALEDPLQVGYCTDAALFIVAEKHKLALWDTRMATCVKRLSTDGDIYAIACSNNQIGAAGATRTVHVFDTKRLIPAGKWVGATKYDITSLHFVESDPKLCFVSGFDSELVCGEWKSKSGISRLDTLELHVESRWIGMAHDRKTDTLVGATDTGLIYTIYNGAMLHYYAVNQQTQPSNKRSADAISPPLDAANPAKRLKASQEFSAAQTDG